MLDLSKYEARMYVDETCFRVDVSVDFGNPDAEHNKHCKILPLDEAIEFVKTSDNPYYIDLNTIDEYISEDFNLISELIWQVYSQLPTDKISISEVYLGHVMKNIKRNGIIPSRTF